MKTLIATLSFCLVSCGVARSEVQATPVQPLEERVFGTPVDMNQLQTIITIVQNATGRSADKIVFDFLDNLIPLDDGFMSYGQVELIPGTAVVEVDTVLQAASTMVPVGTPTTCLAATDLDYYLTIGVMKGATDDQITAALAAVAAAERLSPMCSCAITYGLLAKSN